MAQEPKYTPPPVEVGDVVLIFTDFRPAAPNNPGVIATVSKVNPRTINAWSPGLKFQFEGLLHRQDPLHKIRPDRIHDDRGAWELGPQVRRMFDLEKRVEALEKAAAKAEASTSPAPGATQDAVVERRGPGRPRRYAMPEPAPSAPSSPPQQSVSV